MMEICEEKMCAGCMACVAVCPKKAITINEGVGYYNPVIDQGSCVDCGRCVSVCQQLHPAQFREPLEWKQGWATNRDDRLRSSSGGFGYAIAKTFVENGGSVISCAFRNGRFGFEASDSVSGLEKFRGSKYVKSDPTDAYSLVLDCLESGKKVLFIGLPCQVSGLLNYVGERRVANLYTIDLICHGSPSPKVLEDFLLDKGFMLDTSENISFRRKTSFALRRDGVEIDGPDILDRYSMAFLSGLSYTENCYSCTYAKRVRVSDITLGDSWGTELEHEEAEGISLVLCMTSKGEELLSESNLTLAEVDIENAIKNNHQLENPTQKPAERDVFIENYRAGLSFSKNVARCYPKWCRTLDFKRILVRSGIWGVLKRIKDVVR